MNTTTDGMAEGGAGISGLVAKAIADLRVKLLDLSLRNRLINFKFSETSKKFVRVIDELPDELFTRLTDESAEPKKLYFQPLPEPDEATDPAESTQRFMAALDEARLTDPAYLAAVSNGNGADAEQVEESLKSKVRADLGLVERGKTRKGLNLVSWAEENGINPSYDLPEPGGRDNPAHHDNKIQTLLLPDALERKTSALREDARIAEQELGLSTLHAAFGFLEWMESSDSQVTLFAPLVLLPVRIDREIRANRYRYFIQSGAGQDAVINLTLRERLLRDFNIKLPDFDDDDTPESYLRKVRSAVSSQRRWKTRRFVVIGHFSFARLAMYEDLDPGRWGEMPPHEQELVSSILAGAVRDGGDSVADEYEVDTPEVEKVVPLLITDADSSQYSALVDAMRGRSFALKGPPGTGKSQTITNLIAAALASGKSVLFVAEKMAALEVVSKRLRDAGLGPFLLELHSTKAQKRQVLESFDERLHFGRRGGGRVGHSLQTTLEQLKRTREELRSYIDLLNTAVGQTETTLHDVFWLEQRARRLVDEAVLAQAASVGIDGAQTVSPSRLKERDQLVGEYAEQRARVRRLSDDGERHPLTGIDRPSASQFDVHPFTDVLSEINSATQQCLAVLERFGSAFNGARPTTIDGMRTLGAALGEVPPVSSDVDPRILEGLKERASLDELGAAVQQMDQLLIARDQVVRVYAEPERLLENLASVERMTELLNSACRAIGGHEDSLSQAGEALVRELSDTDLAWHGLGQVSRLRELLSLPAESDRSAGVIALLDAMELIQSNDEPAIRHRHAALTDSGAVETLDQLTASALLSRDEIRRLSRSYDLARCPGFRELAAIASRLEETNSVVFLIGKDGRAARRLFREVASRKAASRAEIVSIFRELSGALERKERIEGDPNLQRYSGRWYAGIDTPVDELGRAAKFIRQVMQRFALLDPTRGSVGGAVIHADDKILDAARQVPPPTLGATRRIVESRRWRLDEPIAPQLTEHRKLIQEAAATVGDLIAIGANASLRIADLIKAHRLAHALLERRSALESACQWLGIAVPASLSCERDRNRVSATSEFALAVEKLALPKSVKDRLLSKHVHSQRDVLLQFGSLIRDASKNLAAKLESGKKSLGLDLVAFAGAPSMDRVDLVAFDARLGRAISLRDSDKSDWISYRRSALRLDELGLADVRSLIDNHNLDAKAAEAVHRAVHFRSLVRYAFGSAQLGFDWTGLHLDGLRGRLASLDREYLKLSRQSIAETVRNRPVPQGVAQGAASALTELSLIEREVGKQRRHIPLRSLLARAGSAAQALKPCFMMSPASVSQFLPAIPGWFDLVIIDEASQMRPEEAIGALSRAKQSVVVGDPMQLPPTSFFDAGQAESVAVEEDGLDVDSESILDRALSALYPARDLRWHYRSRHHSLIAFSNRQFYGDRLFVFPSPADRASDLGVSLVQVANGQYKSSINPEEADQVVRTVANVIRRTPDRSIGVVAVNQPQKELLLERFDRLFAEDEKLEAYRAKWSGTLEEFFVKNLENVQGDERDVIVVSTVYGPDRPGGQVFQRFGPINSNVGHRRLNVLFTRAKERVLLVSSLSPEQIVLSESSKPGVRALKAYLEYARSGRLEQGVTGLGGHDSPFEAEVSEVIEQLGYEVEPQVGVAGYRIDLAVRSKTNRDHFVVGIECDGATYHSAKSARDRDRLRQEILERLGWNLYRIWSTDWFLNREREVGRLRRHLDEVMAAH